MNLQNYIKLAICKTIGVAILFILMTSGLSLSARTPSWTIVIDAGHGGKDPGALGKHSQEKNIVLSIALLTGEYITKNFPDVKVIYTRSTDVFVELYRRAEIANDAKANLFISIHCNANAKTSPHGTEVFVMGLNKTEDNLEVAMKENASVLLEENHESRYDGIDPNSSEAYIAFSLYQNMFLERSLSMAQFIMKNFNQHVGLFERGIKQAPFFVLYKTTMPSILIETGFISNLSDEQFLMNKDNQKRIAYAIYNSFVLYRNLVDKTNIKAIDAPAAVQTSTSDSTSQQNNSNIVFRVQFATYLQDIPITDKRFNGLKKVRYYKDGQYYKYTCGEEATAESAFALQKEVVALGFTDAFVVAFEGETRISVQQAKAKLNP